MAALLVVGLGNPGPAYATTRHNVGFLVVNTLAQRLKTKTSSNKFSSAFVLHTDGEDTWYLMQPLTYMNRSGMAVQQALRFYKLSMDQMVVVHDELDVPFEDIRLKKGGGFAGHNGLKSIGEHCGADFARLRIGIGRPPLNVTPSDYVLQPWTSREGSALGPILGRACDAILCLKEKGLQHAMNTFNRRN